MAPEPSAAALETRCRSCRPDGDALTDGQLLELFIQHRNQADLARLIERHSRMVWGVCRRVLRRHQDAEDAFQAAFMVLVRKAATIRDQERVGNWLYGVARQSAVRMRSLVAKSNLREGSLQAVPEPAERDFAQGDDWRSILDQELSRLPDHYRILIVLCDLEAETRSEVARRLGIPAGTVAGRLFRARELLKQRLTRRGVVVSGVLSAALAPSIASACAPSALIATTIASATARVAGQAADGAISPVVKTLIKSLLTSGATAKAKLVFFIVTAALVAVSVTPLLSTKHSSQASSQLPLAARESDPTLRQPCRLPTRNQCVACHAQPRQFAPHFQPVARGTNLAVSNPPAPLAGSRSVN